MITDNKNIIKPVFENIPQELKEWNQWVAWKAAPRENGIFAKVPVNPLTGANAFINGSSSWGTYDQAATYYNGGNVDGIGFVFTDIDPFCGIDLDNCRNPFTGKITDWALEVIDDLGSYAEVSPSGTGIKIFCKGKLDSPGRNFGDVEIYSSKRFFTVTGDKIPDCSANILERTDQVNQIWQRFTQKKDTQNIDIDALDIPINTKKLIRSVESIGKRSETIMSVIDSLVRADASDQTIYSIFDQNPIGGKYREKGSGKKEWLKKQIDKARGFVSKSNQSDPNHQFDETIQKLNQKHAVIMLGGKCLIMNEIVDPVFKRPDISFSSIQDFNNFYSNQKISVPDVTGRIGIAKHWIESPDRRQYQGIVFSPKKDLPGYYNLFRGFSVVPKQGDWSLFRNHVFDVIAGGNEKAYNYIIAWIAHLFQDPGGNRPGTAIVLRGKQGTGKGVFVSQIGRILGNHYLHITNQRQITGRFNNHLKDALLVFCDEGIWAGSKSDEGVLKAMITEDQIMVEPKGKDPYAVKNHIRLIVASNNDWVVPAGNFDRRFFVLDVSDVHMQDRSYFASIIQQMDNGGREAMLYDMLRQDLTGFDFGKFPHTQARLDQIMSSMSSVQKFWLDKLNEGKLDEYSACEDWAYIEVKKLYGQYMEFAKSMGDRYPLISTQFGRELRKLCPGIDRKRGSSPNREWCYFFQELEACRKSFENFVGQDITWQ